MITADHKHLTSLVVNKLKKDLRADNVSVSFVETHDGGDYANITFYFDCFPDFSTRGPIEDIKRIMRGPNGESLYAEVLQSLKRRRDANRKTFAGGDLYDDKVFSLTYSSHPPLSKEDFIKQLDILNSTPSPPDSIFNPLPSPTAPPMKNYENIIQLAQDEIMTTAFVSLDETSSRYLYRCPKAMAQSLTVDSLVLVPVRGNDYTSLKVGKVKEVHSESQVEAGGTPLRLIVCPVHLLDFEEQLRKEAKMVESMKQIDAEEGRKKAKSAVLAALTLSEKQILGLPSVEETK